MDVGTWIIPAPTQLQTYASTHLAITTGRGDKSHIQSALCNRISPSLSADSVWLSRFPLVPVRGNISLCGWALCLPMLHL